MADLDIAIKGIEKETTSLVEKVDNLPMETIEEAASASVVMKDISTKKKEVDEQRKFFTQPLNDQVKKVNDLFRPTIDMLDKAEKTIKENIVKYAKSDSFTPNSFGNATLVKKYKVNVVDEKKVPKEYFSSSVNMAKVQAEVDAGNHEIPGIEVFLNVDVRVK